MEADPDSDSVMLQLLLLVIFTWMNAFFAGAEMAVVSVDRNRIRALAQEGNRKAVIIQGLFEDTDGKDLLDTLILVRAKVLTGKVHSRLMETVHQYIDKALNIGGRTVTGHQRIAVESVDRGLNDYIGYSKHGALNACG